MSWKFTPRQTLYTFYIHIYWVSAISDFCLFKNLSSCSANCYWRCCYYYWALESAVEDPVPAVRTSLPENYNFPRRWESYTRLCRLQLERDLFESLMLPLEPTGSHTASSPATGPAVERTNCNSQRHPKPWDLTRHTTGHWHNTWNLTVFSNCKIFRGFCGNFQLICLKKWDMFYGYIEYINVLYGAID